MPSFDELDLDPRVLQVLSEIGYETPSPIQAQTIPPLLEGHDVMGLAQTGTGKTAAFALPILSRLDLDAKTPQALVLAPTRELAIQVAEAFQRYAAHLPGFHVLPIYGGQSYGPQLAGLKRGAHVVVGTPGRVIDHLNKGSLDLTGLKNLVLDEADEMLRMGFIEDVETILQSVPEQRQVALFSATMPPQIRKISQSYLNEPVEISVKTKTTTATNITQRYIPVRGPAKLDALTRILEVETFDAMIVFVRTKQLTEELAEKLQARGFSAAAINGDIPQAARERTIGHLREGRVDILVATDVAARGLDVERISHVLNYDIPHDSESYVHRIGRTGRAGRSGEAILFVSPRERHMLRSIEKATRQSIGQMELPSIEAVNDQRLAKFAQGITDTLAKGDLELFKGLVEEYERTHDVPAAEIAAALASMVQGDQPLLMEREPEPEPNRRGRDGGAAKFQPTSSDTETYRVEVGRRNRVTPSALVGALANEGGLPSKHIGHIDIRDGHTLIELPADLPDDMLRKLRKTQVAGRGLRISLADGEFVARRPHGPGRDKPRPHRKGQRSPGSSRAVAGKRRGDFSRS
ncbi:ATP-dependent RNA helicase CsdA [Saccharopolyspora erythraea NRRL 2338]|uniref:ATP-dependent RNA helicase DeaD n=2 Tax=Saccharopolyspora erythraea TaxID=1836 RepID=A4FMF6_SACEN|nr:DEAD/DEAH box helicase [Saccharopolyspora erythraea]EQD87804.1 cold-shock protein [Saccharopolyspora erythraea D]PFG98879.1 ATP-dependent RNA helicase CsdA [Saccharopolyspora erythraea NRRL 2338]QRK88868.1 DEAD/DEAH box helicase [Saccharopolyspora erythraea]CAM05231.1 ATP-dependent RNA helicase [Saccharopolyspora erythraea NRRL 2338]